MTYVNAVEYLLKNKVHEEYLENSMRKMLEYEAHTLRRNLNEMNDDVRNYEEKYSMKSDEFIGKFNKGQIGDETDFIDWFALVDTKKRLENSLANVEKSLCS